MWPVVSMRGSRSSGGHDESRCKHLAEMHRSILCYLLAAPGQSKPMLSIYLRKKPNNNNNLLPEQSAGLRVNCLTSSVGINHDEYLLGPKIYCSGWKVDQ